LSDEWNISIHGGGETMTITQACGYVTSTARKRIVQQTIDRTKRRKAIDAISDELRKNRNHALLQKILSDNKIKSDKARQALLEETIRDIAIRQQYDVDQEFANEVNADLA
jgi:hypothetical protein